MEWAVIGKWQKTSILPGFLSVTGSRGHFVIVVYKIFAASKN